MAPRPLPVGKVVLLTVALLAVAVLVVWVAQRGPADGQTAGPAGSAGAAGTSDGAGTAGAPPDAVPDADRAAIEVTVDAVNAVAGRTPAEQRTILESTVDPTRLADQGSCRPAVTTIRFEPAWPDLRRTGDGRYVLPTLIRIYQGTRITGTDVGALEIVIAAGRAHLPPLCVT